MEIMSTPSLATVSARLTRGPCRNNMESRPRAALTQLWVKTAPTFPRRAFHLLLKMMKLKPFYKLLTVHLICYRNSTAWRLSIVGSPGLTNGIMPTLYQLHPPRARCSNPASPIPIGTVKGSGGVVGIILLLCRLFWLVMKHLSPLNGQTNALDPSRTMTRPRVVEQPNAGIRRLPQHQLNRNRLKTRV